VGGGYCSTGTATIILIFTKGQLKGVRKRLGAIVCVK